MASQPRLLIDAKRFEPLTNVELEAEILGGLLQDNALFDIAVERISAEDFFEPVHQRIYSAIVNEISLGRKVTPVNLRPMFDGDEAFSALGGIGYLARLTGSSTAMFSMREYVEQLSDLSRLRGLFAGATAFCEAVMDTSEGLHPARHAADLERIAFEASAAKTETASMFSVADSIDRVITRIESIRTSGVAIGAVAPDIPELTRVIGPIERQHMHVWAARPGMGKSALMCGAARSMAQEGFGVGVVSLEMGDIDLGQRFASDICLSLGEPILHAEIRDAKLSDGQLKILRHAADQVRRMPLKLVDTTGINMAQLRMLMRRMKREFEANGQTLDVVFVDYLQLLFSDRRTDNRVGDMTEVSNGLKRLAKELKIGVVALSQLSRQVEQRESKVPQMSDLRETGAIEQDADTICFLYRESYYLEQKEPDKSEKPAAYMAWREAMDSCRDHLDLIVPKRRGGATGRSQTTFLREYQAVRRRDFVATGGLGL